MYRPRHCSALFPVCRDYLQNQTRVIIVERLGKPKKIKGKNDCSEFRLRASCLNSIFCQVEIQTLAITILDRRCNNSVPRVPPRLRKDHV